jgi:hypothetical protein
MKKSLKAFLVILILVLTASTCEKYDDIEITWVKTQVMSSSVYSYVTYGYDGGVRTTWIWHSKFQVDGETSGEIKITAKGPDNKETCIEFVEAGKIYKISVTGSVTTKEVDCEVILESPSFDTKTIVSTEFKTSIREIAIEEVE